LKNIQDPYNLISGAVSETLTQIFRTCPFLFPFQTRLLFFKLISFIGSIDMNRSIYFLRQFLKQKLGKLPPEDKNSVKLQKQKVIVDRTKILECSFNLLSKVSNRAFLEVEYKDEQGTGLGPTLEFYYLVA
jgi:E3 ubiquitin-protein ligase TRIP12